MVKYIIAIVVFLIVLAGVYVRLAPIDLRAIHVQASHRDPGNYPVTGGFVAVREVNDSPLNMMGAVNRVILKTERTERIAGDIGTTVMTYRTRSMVFGFPDLAAVSFIEKGEAGNDKPLMIIKSHLIYGISDIGANQRRVLGWLDELGDLTVAP
jgi:hypothetical protein